METKKDKKLSERIALAGIVLLTFMLLFSSIGFERRVNRQKTMYFELQILRTSVQLYKAVNNMQNPSTLQDIVHGVYKFPLEGQSRRFIDYTPVFNDNGQVCDPFGNVYSYDASTGWVKSQTNGYEFW